MDFNMLDAVHDESRYREYVCKAPYGVFVTDAEGRFLEVNAAGRRMSGYTEKQLLSMSFLDLVPTETPMDWKDHFHRFPSINGFSGEFTYRHAGGELRQASVLAVEFPDGRYLGFAHDLTEIREAERERLRFEAVARHQQRMEAIATLASGVAHEINNPLNVIMNFGQLASDEAESPARVRQYSERIIHECERAAHIIKNLMRFARQDRTGPGLVRVDELVGSTLSLVRALLRTSHIELETRIPEGTPVLWCCSQPLQQVLMNLLSNSRDALDSRFPGRHPNKRIRIEASVFEEHGAPWVRISVADSGGGIPPEYESRVFDPFFTTKVRELGTGLGLSVAYGIIQEHCGRIWFDNRPGDGVTFHLDLPQESGRNSSLTPLP